MNEEDLAAREDPHIICNKCKEEFHPYPERYAPFIDVVVCPSCGEKRILYYGEDAATAKMILSNIGMNKDLLERIDEIENKITIMKAKYEQGLIAAQKTMSEALLGAVREELKEHESKWHPTSQKSLK